MPPQNAGAAGKPKQGTKKSRKSRTEIIESSSSSSSEASSDTESSSSDSEAAAPPKPSKKQKTTTSARDTDMSSSSSSSASASSSDSDDEGATPASSTAAFPSWYLRTVTQELAEDLDKVRGAPDFGDQALPLLVHALQQGEACFSRGEKARVMGAAVSG